MEQYPEVLGQIQYDKKNGMLGQSSLSALFSGAQTPSREKEYALSELLAKEKGVLGIYLSGHPLDEHYEQWIANITAKSGDFRQNEDGCPIKDGETATVGGMIQTVTVRTTRKKKQMACLVLEDLIGSMEVVVFPEQYEKYKSFLTEGALVFCKGKVKKEEAKDASLQADLVANFSDKEQAAVIWLQFNDFADYQKKEAAVVSCTRKHPGNGSLNFFLKNTKQIKQGSKSISLDMTFLNELAAICGEENVKVI